MDPVYLFDLASRQSQWLSVRQATIATNIANANTPNFKARDVAAFDDTLAKTQLAMAGSSPFHLTASGAEFGTVESKASNAWEVSPSGNTVTLEQELLNAGDVNRGFALNTSIIKSFHRMLMSCVKV